jgi:hypothetical protein
MEIIHQIIICKQTSFLKANVRSYVWIYCSVEMTAVDFLFLCQSTYFYSLLLLTVFSTQPTTTVMGTGFECISAIGFFVNANEYDKFLVLANQQEQQQSNNKKKKSIFKSEKGKESTGL